MRWKESCPEIGETRIRSGFLLFPKTANCETRWLEWAEWEEEYALYPTTKIQGGLYGKWQPSSWVERNN